MTIKSLSVKRTAEEWKNLKSRLLKKIHVRTNELERKLEELELRRVANKELFLTAQELHYLHDVERNIDDYLKGGLVC